jgi:hypothetical protein
MEGAPLAFSQWDGDDMWWWLDNTTDNVNLTQSHCTLFQERCNDNMFSQVHWKPYTSCCASSIFPGEHTSIDTWLHAIYEDLQSLLTDQDQGWDCFEFLVYKIIVDDYGK